MKGRKVCYREADEFFNGAGELKGKSIALWEFSLKLNTDNMREAPSLVLIRSLFATGAKVHVFDPEAADQVERLLLAEHGAANCKCVSRAGFLGA